MVTQLAIRNIHFSKHNCGVVSGNFVPESIVDWLDWQTRGEEE